MGYVPTIWPRASAFPTRGPTRSLRENPNRKWQFENLALEIFWKSDCFLNLPCLPAKHMNHTIQFAFEIIVSHHEKQEFEVRNKQSRTSKQVPTRDCLRSLSYIILRICLRETYAPSRIAYAWMMWVPPQSKFHHLSGKKTWLTWTLEWSYRHTQWRSYYNQLTWESREQPATTTPELSQPLGNYPETRTQP